MFVYGGNETCREAATQLSITWRMGPALAFTRAGLSTRYEHSLEIN